MAATPQKATFKFVGASGRKYQVAAYISDVSAALLTFNPNGAAGSTSQTYWIAPENVVLDDIMVVTGTVDTVGMNLTSGGAIIPNTSVLYSTVLTTLQNRSVPTVGFRAGSFVGATQFA